MIPARALNPGDTFEPDGVTGTWLVLGPTVLADHDPRGHIPIPHFGVLAADMRDGEIRDFAPDTQCSAVRRRADRR